MLSAARSGGMGAATDRCASGRPAHASIRWCGPSSVVRRPACNTRRPSRHQVRRRGWEVSTSRRGQLPHDQPSRQCLELTFRSRHSSSDHPSELGDRHRMVKESEVGLGVEPDGQHVRKRPLPRDGRRPDRGLHRPRRTLRGRCRTRRRQASAATGTHQASTSSSTRRLRTAAGTATSAKLPRASEHG